MNIYSFSHLNASISIFHMGLVENTVDPNKLINIINQVYNNTVRYFGNIFDKLEIEVWDIHRSDIPKNSVVCEGNTCKKVLGIANYAGLTWTGGNVRKIQLSSIVCINDKELELAFCHELGHYIDWFSDFNYSSNPLMPIWNSIRGIHATASTSKVELMAEDIMKFFGSSKAAGSLRTDEHNCLQPYHVRGLHDLLLIWKLASDFIAEAKVTNYISPIKFNTSITNVKYCSLEFEFLLSPIGLKNTFIIDVTGIKLRQKIFFFNLDKYIRKF